jgi:hypothetical protein
MMHSPFIQLLLGAVSLVGLGAAYFVWRTREDWGPVGHDVLVTRRAPPSVQAAAFVGLLLCPIYVLPAVVGAVVFLVTLPPMLRGAGSPELEVTGILKFLAGPIALLLMGVAAPFGLVRTSLALLLRELNAAARARRTATIHICLGGILGAFGAMAVVLSTADWFAWMYAATLCIAPPLAAHGLLLRHAASAVDAYEASRSQQRR